MPPPLIMILCDCWYYSESYYYEQICYYFCLTEKFHKFKLFLLSPLMICLQIQNVLRICCYGLMRLCPVWLNFQYTQACNCSWNQLISSFLFSVLPIQNSENFVICFFCCCWSCNCIGLPSYTMWAMQQNVLSQIVKVLIYSTLYTILIHIIWLWGIKGPLKKEAEIKLPFHPQQVTPIMMRN